MDEKYDIESIIKRYLKPVYNLAFRLSGNEGDAGDITQEVFIKVWKNLPHPSLSRRPPLVQGRENLRPWIFKIARNTAIDWLRKRKNISFSQLDSLGNQEGNNGDKKYEETIVSIEPLPDEIFEKKELAKELETALLKIRPDFREIIFLRYSENMTFEEISGIVGKPPNTVKSHHHRALSALRKLLLL